VLRLFLQLHNVSKSHCNATATLDNIHLDEITVNSTNNSILQSHETNSMPAQSIADLKLLPCYRKLRILGPVSCVGSPFPFHLYSVSLVTAIVPLVSNAPSDRVRNAATLLNNDPLNDARAHGHSFLLYIPFFSLVLIYGVCYCS
jgi:hypothetical protein